MELRDALKSDYHEAQRDRGLSAAQINVAFGHSGESSWAYQMMAGDMPMPLAMVSTWRRLTGARHLMQWIAAETKHATAPLPVTEAGPADVYRAAADALEAFGEAMKHHAAAVRDGIVTREESELLWHIGERVIGAIFNWMLSARAASGRASRAATLADTARVAS